MFLKNTFIDRPLIAELTRAVEVAQPRDKSLQNSIHLYSMEFLFNFCSEAKERVIGFRLSSGFFLGVIREEGRKETIKVERKSRKNTRRAKLLHKRAAGRR